VTPPRATKRDDLLRNIARGSESWLRLAEHGISIRFEGTGLTIDAPRGFPVAVTAEDLASGLRRYANDLGDLRVWARVVHSSSNLFDLALDTHPRGEELLDLLWRLSFGEDIKPEEITTLASEVLGPQ